MAEKTIEKLIKRDWMIAVGIITTIILFIVIVAKQGRLNDMNTELKQTKDKLVECSELLQTQQKIIRDNQDFIKMKALIDTKGSLEQELVDNSKQLEELKNLYFNN